MLRQGTIKANGFRTGQKPELNTFPGYFVQLDPEALVHSNGQFVFSDSSWPSGALSTSECRLGGWSSSNILNDYRWPFFSSGVAVITLCKKIFSLGKLSRSNNSCVGIVFPIPPKKMGIYAKI